MTWKFAVVALLGLSACSTTGIGAGTGGPKAVKKSSCNAKAYSYLRGQPQSAVQKIAFDQPARITKLGDIASSDNNPERITFTIDKLDNVVGIKCG